MLDLREQTNPHMLPKGWAQAEALGAIMTTAQCANCGG